MKISEKSLSMLRAGRIKSYPISNYYFPGSDVLLDKFKKMAFCEITKFMIPLEYHVVALEICADLRKVTIIPRNGSLDLEHSITLEHTRRLNLQLQRLYGLDADLLDESMTVFKTTGFKVPNYVGEFKKADPKHKYLVTWDVSILFSADYLDFSEHSYKDLFMSLKFSDAFDHLSRLEDLVGKHECHKLLVSWDVYEEILRAANLCFIHYNLEEVRSMFAVKD